tara:strand:+ start:517 stop:1107 length:591 start_codon:yes stop_codon:yes gene_type:complete
MQGLFDFIVKPKGKTYNNTKKIGDTNLIINSNISDHKYVNRNAIVVKIPKNFDTPINVGDEVIIHHNVFRRWHNIKGIEKQSRSYFKDNLYFVRLDQIYLYKKNDWKAMDGFTFVKPIEETNDFYFFQKENSNVGIIKYTDGTFKKDELIGFHPKVNHEFVIDNELLYKIPNKFIEIKYEYKGNEKAYNPSWAQSS